MITEGIKNKVANSGLITIDLEEKLHFTKEIASIDIKDFLFQAIILKEKDFRNALKEMDWKVYHKSIVAIHCSVDAIIPSWAYMLLGSYLQNNCLFHAVCKPSEVLEQYLLQQLSALPLEGYIDQRIVIKGCGKESIPHSVFMKITAMLIDKSKSIMYGEPCSTVPIYKKTNV